MTPTDAFNLPRTEPEFRAQRLGFALRSLAAELVDERRTVARLQREIAELKARLESRQPPQNTNAHLLASDNLRSKR